MSLKEKITNDMKDAMRAGDKPRLGVIRLILAAIKQREVDERITLDDSQVLAVLDKMMKQRRDSVTQYQNGNRQDLADQELAEIALIQAYLPAQLSDAELDTLVAEAIQTSGAAGIKDMGKVMGLLKPKVQGRADMGAVSGKIKAKLGG
ncbi:MAG TPA: GatB/YqeY domain-containing protein [Gammaproteobacteria bacterium]